MGIVTARRSVAQTHISVEHPQQIPASANKPPSIHRTWNLQIRYSEEAGGAHRSYMVPDPSPVLELPKVTSSYNTETRSHNHSFRAKAIINKYYELM